MQLLWTILRILGILVLALILLVLLVVSLVLLVPVRYQMWLKNREKPEIKVRLHWLLHLISFTAEYKDELTYRLKILGFTVYDEKTKQSVSAKNNSESSDTSEKSQKQPETQEKTQSELSGQQNLRELPKQQKQQETPKQPEQQKEQRTEQKQESRQEQAEKKSLREKIEDVLWKIIDFLQLIPNKIAGVLEKWADLQENLGERVDAFLDKIDEWNRKKERLLKQIEDEQNRFAVVEGCKTVKKLIVHIRPRKLKVTGRLGFDDPALTGQIFAVIGMLMPLYGEHIQLEAAFNETVMDIDAYLSGRLRAGSMTYMILRLILRKEVRGLLRQFSKPKTNGHN